MAQVTITSKGQVTIPKSIRDKLSLVAGDKVEFVITENNETIMRPITKRVDDVFGRLYKPDRAALSVEEMNEAVKKRAQESVA
jgi:antitoxin PrlF